MSAHLGPSPCPTVSASHQHPAVRVGSAPPRPLPLSPLVSSASPQSHTFPLASVCVPTSSPPTLGRCSVPQCHCRQVGAVFLQVISPSSSQFLVPQYRLRVVSASPQCHPLSRGEFLLLQCRHSLVSFPWPPGLLVAVGRGCAARVGKKSREAVDLPHGDWGGRPVGRGGRAVSGTPRVAALLQLLIVEYCSYPFCRIF